MLVRFLQQHAHSPRLARIPLGEGHHEGHRFDPNRRTRDGVTWLPHEHLHQAFGFRPQLKKQPTAAWVFKRDKERTASILNTHCSCWFFLLSRAKVEGFVVILGRRTSHAVTDATVGIQPAPTWCVPPTRILASRRLRTWCLNNLTA